MRDPKAVFARYGRQLLVHGVAFEGQQQLPGWSAVLASDGSELGRIAAEAAARYLVGAGVGAIAVPGADPVPLRLMDRDLTVLKNAADADPPVAHFFFATRRYGASVDLAVTDDAHGWREGLTGPARVATLRCDLGRRGEPSDAVALGAAAAELLLADVLRLEPLPAVVCHDWRDPAEPRMDKHAAAPREEHRPMRLEHPSLRAEIVADAEVMRVLRGDCALNYPREACGLLVRGSDGTLGVVVGENLQDKYHELDPIEFPRTSRTAYKLDERLMVRAADRGQQVMAIYHTHCDAGAYFSAEDVRCAVHEGAPLYPGIAYVVISVAGGAMRQLEVYRFDPRQGTFAAEPNA